MNAEQVLAEQVAEIIDGWPPVQPEQLARIAALLTAGGTG